jgi:gluconate 2-dehydrogenase gamma chain
VANTPLNRRNVLIGGVYAGSMGAEAVAGLRDGQLGAPPREFGGQLPWTEGVADAPPAQEGDTFRFFTEVELNFIVPAIDRLIPRDPHGPSASEANVHIFLDRQLAGLYGRGDHFYLGGPWPEGTPEQGYQGRLSPAQLYRISIPAVERYVHDNLAKSAFRLLSPGIQDKVLSKLESGEVKLSGVPGTVFFAMFLQNVLEGYFSDPIYGGNKDMGAWKMIGFPGAHYDYREWAGRHGRRVPFSPVGIKGRPGWSEA